MLPKSILKRCDSIILFEIKWFFRFDASPICRILESASRDVAFSEIIGKNAAA